MSAQVVTARHHGPLSCRPRAATSLPGSSIETIDMTPPGRSAWKIGFEGRSRLSISDYVRDAGRGCQRLRSTHCRRRSPTSSLGGLVWRAAPPGRSWGTRTGPWRPRRGCRRAVARVQGGANLLGGIGSPLADRGERPAPRQHRADRERRIVVAWCRTPRRARGSGIPASAASRLGQPSGWRPRPQPAEPEQGGSVSA
jgi:hypothetical protein